MDARHGSSTVRARARWAGRAAVVALLLLGTLLGAPAAASAHATLVSTAPTDGSRLEHGPAAVAFTLDEPVSVVQGSPQVVDQDGTRYPVADAALSAGRTVLTVRLAAALPDGSFLATARLLSPDTHVVSVSAAFTVGAPRELLTAPQAAATGAADRIASAVLRVLVYAGAAGFAGVLLTTGLLWPRLRSRPRWRWLVRCGAGVLVAGLAGRLVAEAAHRAGGLGGVSAETVAGLFTGNAGFPVAATAALAVTLLAAPVVTSRRGLPGPGGVRRLRVAGVAAAAAAVTAVALGGHGADPALFPLPLLLTLLHAHAAVAWLGGVAVVAVVAVVTVEPHGGVPVAAWHRYAVVHVAVLVGTGAALALLRVPAPAALAGTSYGLALAVKVALVAAALAAAAAVHRRLVRAVPERRAAARRGGLRFLGAELALVAGALGATGVLASAVPAAVSYDPAVRTTVDFGGGAVLGVAIPSTRRGPQALVVESPAGGQAPPSVDLSSRDANVARLPVRFGGGEPAGTGLRWTSRDLVVPVAGDWRVTVTVETAAGPRVASFHYTVR